MKYQNEGVYGVFINRKWSGQPRVTTSRKDRLMRKAVIYSQMNNSKKIQAKLIETGTAISTKTSQRKLSLEFDPKSCKPALKLGLTQAMKKKCLDFAKRHGSWDIEM